MLVDTVDNLQNESYKNRKGSRTCHLNMATMLCLWEKCGSTLGQLGLVKYLGVNN